MLNILNMFDCYRYFSCNGDKYLARVISKSSPDLKESWVLVRFVNQRTKEKSGYFHKGYLINKKAFMNKYIKRFQRNNGHV